MSEVKDKLTSVPPILEQELEAIRQRGEPVSYYDPDTNFCFIYSPKLGEVLKDLRERIASGELPFRDARKFVSEAITWHLRKAGVRLKGDSDDV